LTLDFVSHYPEWHHVLFKVKDADLSIRFYSDFLGMGAVQHQRDGDGKRWVWMRFSENPYAPLFVFVEEPQGKTPTGAHPLFGFRLPDLKPVEEISAKAKAENCLVEAAAYGGHTRGYFCQISDPDGNLLEFSYQVSHKPGQGQ
jgi:catechol 2,3-dioxygenase-like lactoylglutathione lyase family enzyme